MPLVPPVTRAVEPRRDQREGFAAEAAVTKRNKRRFPREEPAEGMDFLES